MTQFIHRNFWLEEVEDNTTKSSAATVTEGAIRKPHQYGPNNSIPQTILFLLQLEENI